MNPFDRINGLKRRHSMISTNDEFLNSYDEYILQNSFPKPILETMNSIERFKLFNLMKTLIKLYKFEDK
jgi:hypothetical protein